MASNKDFFPEKSLQDLVDCIFDDGFEELFEAETVNCVEQLAEVFLYECPHPECNKQYKTKGGLKRHEKLKHQTTINLMEMVDFKRLVEQAAAKLAVDPCYPHNFQEVFKCFTIKMDEIEVVWSNLKKLVEGFNGNAEKFYSGFYAFIQPGKPQLFQSLGPIQSTLLSTELANLCLEFMAKPAKTNSTLRRNDIKFSEKDIASLQYLSGYCFRTIYSRLRNSPKNRSANSQQCMSVLQAGKCNVDADMPAQRLVDARDRGGLWKVNEKAHAIFRICEIEFQITTSSFHTTLNAEQLVSDLLKDVVIRSNFNTICSKADVKIDKEVGKELLHNFFLLYVRVRSHSYAKKLKETHKQQKKEGKQKSLRTTIKQRTSTTDLGH